MSPRFVEMGLLVFVVFVAVGALPLWRKRLLATGALFGAAVGMVACLYVFEYVAVVSISGNYAYVSFALIGQREFHPLWEYSDGRQAQAAADYLNRALGIAGAVAGAAIGLGVAWLLRKRRAPGQPVLASDRAPAEALQ